VTELIKVDKVKIVACDGKNTGSNTTEWVGKWLFYAIFCCYSLPFFWWWYWVLNSGPTPWATTPTLFCEGFFEIGSQDAICPGWLWTKIHMISAS
jgi:hypothetical protein